MGATGSGKTTVRRALPAIMIRNSPGCLQFINLAAGSSLQSRANPTAEVQFTNEFTLDRRAVTLIDTPGFDDTSKSDAEVLKTIAAFLATA